MKKRLLALALALGLTVSLAACSGGAGTPSTPAPETAAPETAAPETAAAGSDVAYVQDKGTLVVGMTEGLFSGARLSDYFSGTKADWTGARKIVNGTDRAKKIAVTARTFDAAIRAGLMV